MLQFYDVTFIQNPHKTPSNVTEPYIYVLLQIINLPRYRFPR